MSDQEFGNVYALPLIELVRQPQDEKQIAVLNQTFHQAFMKASVTFTHAYCQATICTPSRASFLTGMYPSSLSVTTNGNPVFPKYYEDRLVTHRLAKDGYDCGLVGKFHLASAFGRQEARVDDGYRYFQYSHSHKGPNYPGHDYADWMRVQGVDPNGVLRDETPTGDVRIPTEENDNVPPHLHQTFWCTEQSIAFIEKNREEGQPWLLSINPFDPHPPYDGPYEYYRRYDPESLPGAHFQDQDLDLQVKLADAGVEFGSKPQHPREWNDKEM